MALTPAVEQAIAEVRTALPDCAVTIREDGEGGAWVIVDDLKLGPPYLQDSTWVGFRVTFAYPYADVYPHFVRGDLARVDGQPLGEAMSPSAFEGRPAIQLSRRSNHLDPVRDTAMLKLGKVADWLRRRP
jgi:hypothetical protein